MIPEDVFDFLLLAAILILATPVTMIVGVSISVLFGLVLQLLAF